MLRRSEVKRNLGIDIAESEIERILRQVGIWRLTADLAVRLQNRSYK